MKKNIICMIINVISGSFVSQFYGLVPSVIFWVSLGIGGCEAIFLYCKGEK